MPNEPLIYFAAYASYGSRTSYGAVLSGEPQICFAAGTLIRTINGRKKIEDISYNDNLLVWNFDRGCLDVSKPLWIAKPFKSYSYGLVKFSDGSSFKTVADGRGHRLFNVESGKFTYSMSADTPLRTTTFTAGKKLVQVIDKEVIRKRTVFHNVITYKHFNIFANEILTSTGLNNIYEIAGMKFRGSRRGESFTNDWYAGMRLGEQPEDCGPKIKKLLSRRAIGV